TTLCSTTSTARNASADCCARMSAMLDRSRSLSSRMLVRIIDTSAPVPAASAAISITPQTISKAMGRERLAMAVSRTLGCEKEHRVARNAAPRSAQTGPPCPGAVPRKLLRFRKNEYKNRDLTQRRVPPNRARTRRGAVRWERPAAAHAAVPTESEHALDSSVWRIFLWANRCPTPDQVRGRFSPEHALRGFGSIAAHDELRPLRCMAGAAAISCYFTGGAEIALAGGGAHPGCGGSAAAVP